MSNELAAGRIYYRTPAGRYVPLLHLASHEGPDAFLKLVREHDFNSSYVGGSTADCLIFFLRDIIRSTRYSDAVTQRFDNADPADTSGVAYVMGCDYVVDERGIVRGRNVTIRLAHPGELP